MSKRKQWWLVASLAVVAVMVLAACGGGGAPAAPAEAPAAEAPAAEEAEEAPAAAAGEKVLIYGLYQEPEILNPFIRTQTVAIEAAGYYEEGLVRADPDGNYYPQLAVEVPTLENGGVSEDGLTVTYHLRDDVVWSDGVPFTCEDVEFTWQAITHPEGGSVIASNLAAIESVTCPDDHTVVVQYSRFYAPFLRNFMTVVPKHATGDPANMTQWEFNWMPIGTGPFTLQEWIPGDRMVYVKNENYRDYPEKPYLDRVILRIVESREVGKALITSGEIHGLWDLTEADIPAFENNPDITVHTNPGPGSERLLLNLADPTIDATDDPINNPHPLLADLRVRQAIQYGIDKQFIIDELLYGKTTVSTSELSMGWAKCEIPPSEYDPEAAIALLEEAGFTDEDGDGVRECHGCLHAEEGTPLRMKFQTTSGNQLRELSQQLIIEMLREVGIDLYIENVPSAELFGSWSSGAFRKHGKFDVLMFTTSDTVDPQEQMFGYFHSSSIPVEANGGTGFNYSRWINEVADEALVAAAATPDNAERKAAYQIACEQIDAELPHIYLYDRADIDLTVSNLKNYRINSWESQRSWNTFDWDFE
jgi:peptide/nickel transport system substrate-binding protein